MPPRATPYVVLAAAVVLALAAAAVGSTGLRVVLAVLAVAAASACVVLWARAGRDPNGPRGQH